MRSLPVLLGTTLFLGCSAAPSSYTEDKVQAKDVQPAADDEPKKTPASKTSTSESTTADKPVETTPAPAPSATPAPAPAKDDACAKAGPVVYAFEDATGAWRYSTENRAPDGFTAHGPVFRAAATGGEVATVPLYELKNEANGDYLVSTVPTEGAQIGYGAFAVLGQVALEKVDGMVPLVRYLQESPALRHRVGIDGQDDGWEAEPARGFVCPL
jgi:hypothetical protein